MSFLLGNRPGKNGEERHTKSIESLDDIASLLPKGILVQAMTCEAVHLLRFSSSITFSLPLTSTCQIGKLKNVCWEFWCVSA
jgi:hypothetical protein